MANGGDQLAGGGAPQVAPGAPPQGVDPAAIMQVLQQAIQASVDEQGFVDVKQLATIWPQVAQQAGVNIPFETVLQMIQQNPEVIVEIVQQMGLAGIVVDGRQISAEELANVGGGATGNPNSGQPVQPQGGGLA